MTHSTIPGPISLIFGTNKDDLLLSGHDKAYYDPSWGKNGYFSANDIIYGLDGNDWIEGKGGNDKLFGGSGSDNVYGGNGNDHLYGETGSDYLYGGEGNDYLYGGSGHDVLYGGSGNNHLYGDSGSDVFWLASGPGLDFIMDFNRLESDSIYMYEYLEDSIILHPTFSFGNPYQMDTLIYSGNDLLAIAVDDLIISSDIDFIPVIL